MLVELSVVEQRYRAVLAVLAGESVIEVAAQIGVARQTVHRWLARYRDEGLGGLMDRSHRPEFCPHQSPVEVEAAVCELRREHPRWGSRRLAHVLGRSGMAPVPSASTVYRILVRHGLVDAKARRRRREDYKRWERDAPMALWQLDIVGGVFLADGTEIKVVTGVDDHSRFCVIASACVRATGRAVCLAFARALERYGVPEEVLTDNGRQFTARFGRGGEVLFDRICRDNGIVHRLTQPASPTTTGKVERFHQTLRRDLLADHDPFEDLDEVQAALDRWVADDYNTRRPHRSLGMASPAERFAPVPKPSGRRCRYGFRRRWWASRHQPPSWPSPRLSRFCPRRRWRRPERSSSTGWSRPRGTCTWRAASSGWARPAPGSPSRSGPTAT